MNCYEPEGRKIAGTANQRYCGSLEGLREAMAEGVILEGWGARISGARPDLLVDLGGIQGVIPHDEGALGMEDGSTRDIALLTRVGKPVCFVVTGFEELTDGTLRPVLSRRQVRSNLAMDFHSIADRDKGQHRHPPSCCCQRLRSHYSSRRFTIIYITGSR